MEWIACVMFLFPLAVIVYWGMQSPGDWTVPGNFGHDWDKPATPDTQATDNAPTGGAERR